MTAGGGGGRAGSSGEGRVPQREIHELEEAVGVGTEAAHDYWGHEEGVSVCRWDRDIVMREVGVGSFLEAKVDARVMTSC